MEGKSMTNKTKWIVCVMGLVGCADDGAVAPFDAASDANTDGTVETPLPGPGGSADAASVPLSFTATPAPEAGGEAGVEAGDSAMVDSSRGAPNINEVPGGGGSPGSDDYIVSGYNLSAPGMPCDPALLCGGGCPTCPCDCTVVTVLPNRCPSMIQASCLKQCGGSDGVSYTCL
jgi:hypothetical protein